jgi:hypothetical protein
MISDVTLSGATLLDVTLSGRALLGWTTVAAGGR